MLNYRAEYRKGIGGKSWIQSLTERQLRGKRGRYETLTDCEEKIEHAFNINYLTPPD